MNNSLIPFSFESKEIRVVDQNGNPWFILRDLLEAMESKTTTTAAVESIKQGLGDGFVNDIPLQTAGGPQQIIIVAESAATYLLSRSNTDKGRELNRFIHIDVLPTLRKTGSYALPWASSTPDPRLIEVAFSSCLNIAKLCGLSGNMALLSADHGTKALTGNSALTIIGATHLLADPRGRVYTPTELGQRLNPPLSAKKFNLWLEAQGLQKKEMGQWIPTDAAEVLCEWADTGKRHSDGAPVKQLRWFNSVLALEVQPS